MIYSLLIKSTIKGQAMKYTVPEEYQTQFNTLIRSVPVELQDDNEFKETVLVYLKMGGISLARRYAETTARYLNVDVLELGTGLRFPKVVEVKQEDESDEENENEEENEDENEGEDNDDDNGNGTEEEKKPE
jgi:hypothetical protein